MGDFSTSGAAQGAAAGSAFGPWGAVIGGVAGGFLGAGGDNKPPAPVPLPAPTQTPNVSGTYGGMYRDPITGQISFTDTYNYPYFFQNYQNQALMDQLMGGTGQSANALTGLDSQIGLLQNRISGLQKQQAQKIDPTKMGLHTEWLNPDGTLKSFGEILDMAHTGKDPWFQAEFSNTTHGNYGRGGFDQWLKDIYNRNLQPSADKYQKAMDTQKSSNDLIQQQIDTLNAQLQNYNKVKQQYAPGSQTQQQVQQQAASNPMLQNIQSMEDLASRIRETAGNGAYLQQAQGQIGNQMQNAIAQAENDAARRGLGSSSISEMMRARLGLEGAQALNQANYQQQQFGMQALGQAQNATQNALQARLGLVQNLQGLNNNAFNQGLQAQQLNLGQLQLGAGVGANNANALNNYAMGNVAQQNQYNMGNYNAQLAQQMQNQNNWGQAAGAIGYGAQQYFNQPQANYGMYANQPSSLSTNGSQNTWGIGTTGQGGYSWGDMPATTQWSSKLGSKG